MGSKKITIVKNIFYFCKINFSSPLLLLLLMFSLPIFSKELAMCNAWQNREDLDGFCPRLEGVTLPKCCPPLQLKNPLSCSYQIVKNRGQSFLTNSSYTTCENGVNVSKPCCRVNQKACFTSPVTLSFIPRLIYRQESCCFEQCPPASYWRALPNPEAKITAEHELTQSIYSGCTNTVLQECSYGSTDNCPANNYCPEPSVPSTPSGSGSNTSSGSGSNTPSKDSGSTPSKDPGTSTTPTDPQPVEAGET